MKFLNDTVFTYVIKYHLALIFFVLFAHYSADAEATVPKTGFWSFQFENDLWGSGDDRFYTHGTEISFASAETPPVFLDKLADSLPFYRKGDVGIHGFAIGQKIFTPQDTESTEIVVDDRPYAGWLFFNTGIAHLYENQGDKERINGLMLSIGIVGPCSFAEQTQKAVHRAIGSEIPQGWDNQLDNELGINVSYLRKWRQLYRLEKSRQIELSRHGGLTLGNVYTYAAAGLMARWGTHLKNDIGPPTISPGFTGIPAFRPDPTFNWYLFAGIEGRAVARNIFLDGNTFQDSHSVEKENLVADLQFGLAFHFKNVRLAYVNLIRSKEFEGQPEPTNYGAINLTFYTSQ